MNILCLDLELNQPSNKIIQVGAVVFKSNTGEAIESISVFVNPNEQINPEITTLTGITDEMVQGGISVVEAYFKLKEFHKKHRCVKNPIVWGSGTYDDSSCLYNQANPGEENFMGRRVTDAKALYQSRQIRRNGIIKGGLKIACEKMGIEFYGKEHDALYDAINTAKIWMRLTDKYQRKFD